MPPSRLTRINLLWFERRKCLLLAQAGTLFTVFAPDMRKVDLMRVGAVAVRLISHQLDVEELPPDTFGLLDRGAVQVANTTSRTVLGYMNRIALECRYAIADRGGLDRCDIDSLNRELRRELHLSRRPPGYFVPIDLIHKRLVERCEGGFAPS